MPLFSLSRTRSVGPPIEVIGLGTQSIKFKYFICCCWGKPTERIFCLNPFNPFEILLRLPGQQARNGVCYFFSGAGTTVLIFHESSHSSSTGTTGRNQSSIRYTPHHRITTPHEQFSRCVQLFFFLSKFNLSLSYGLKESFRQGLLKCFFRDHPEILIFNCKRESKKAIVQPHSRIHIN